MANDRYDLVIVGAGPAGEAAVRRLAGSRVRVAIVERELVGGECPYWACMPSKTLLRPSEVRLEARRVQGLDEPAQDWSEIARYRDFMISHLADGDSAERLERDGATLIRGAARIAGPGRVVVDDRTLAADALLIATGTETALPDLDGLDTTDSWTNRELLTMEVVPRSAIVLGGGPVGVESARLLCGQGADVTLVEPADRLLPSEDRLVGETIAQRLAEQGVAVRVGVSAVSAAGAGSLAEVTLDDGSTVRGERLVVAAGRRPRTTHLGLETAGVELDDGGAIRVDDQCRAADGVWAAGDVTGIAPFTHVAHYQGRLVADVILGRDRVADYRAIPRVVFGDPEFAAAGQTRTQAEEAGIDLAEGRVDLETLARTDAYGAGYEGEMRVLADRATGALCGAWAIGPMASEWIGAAVVAIKARVPVTTLRDMPMQFPTFGEALSYAVDDLDL